VWRVIVSPPPPHPPHPHSLSRPEQGKFGFLFLQQLLVLYSQWQASVAAASIDAGDGPDVKSQSYVYTLLSIRHHAQSHSDFALCTPRLDEKYLYKTTSGGMHWRASGTALCPHDTTPYRELFVVWSVWSPGAGDTRAGGLECGTS
jgi:hypothetical protein